MLRNLLKFFAFLPILAHAEPYPIACYIENSNQFVSVTISMMQGAIPKFSKKFDVTVLPLMEQRIVFEANPENVKISAIKMSCDYKPSQLGIKLQRHTAEAFLTNPASVAAGQTPSLYIHYYIVDNQSVIMIGHK